VETCAVKWFLESVKQEMKVDNIRLMMRKILDSRFNLDLCRSSKFSIHELFASAMREVDLLQSNQCSLTDLF
jgi:hypothetical protein